MAWACTDVGLRRLLCPRNPLPPDPDLLRLVGRSVDEVGVGRELVLPGLVLLKELPLNAPLVFDAVEGLASLSEHLSVLTFRGSHGHRSVALTTPQRPVLGRRGRIGTCRREHLLLGVHERAEALERPRAEMQRFTGASKPGTRRR